MQTCADFVSESQNSLLWTKWVNKVKKKSIDILCHLKPWDESVASVNRDGCIKSDGNKYDNVDVDVVDVDNQGLASHHPKS